MGSLRLAWPSPSSPSVQREAHLQRIRHVLACPGPDSVIYGPSWIWERAREDDLNNLVAAAGIALGTLVPPGSQRGRPNNFIDLLLAHMCVALARVRLRMAIRRNCLPQWASRVLRLLPGQVVYCLGTYGSAWDQGLREVSYPSRLPAAAMCTHCSRIPLCTSGAYSCTSPHRFPRWFHVQWPRTGLCISILVA